MTRPAAIVTPFISIALNFIREQFKFLVMNLKISIDCAPFVWKIMFRKLLRQPGRSARSICGGASFHSIGFVQGIL